MTRISMASLCVAVFLLSHLLPTFVVADIITFAGPNGEIGIGSPQTEGDFTYEAISGTLWRSDARGNPAPSLEGRSGAGGGVASFIRFDGGLFTFDQVDIAQTGFGATAIVFEGFLGGASQGMDSLITAPGTQFFESRSSVNLAGKAIDQLRVTLDATLTAWESIDNLTLSSASVPEPSSMVVLGICFGVGGFLRRPKERNRPHRS